MKNKKAIGALAITVIIIAGAGAIYYTEAMGNQVKEGTFTISVSDSSGPNISGIYITFTKVMVKDNQSSWETHYLGNQTVNIRHNATNSRNLGSFPMEARNYSEVEFYFNSVNVSINGVNTSFSLTENHFTTTHTLRILPHQSTIMLLEFNATRDLNLSAHTFSPNARIFTSF